MRTTFGAIILVSALAALGGCSGGDGNKSPRIIGSGSSFVAPLMKTWANGYNKATQLEVDYTSKGSGTGIAEMIDQKNDFGATDAPLNDEQLKKAHEKNGDVINIPLTMGPVAPFYNLPEIDKPLNFTGPILADIFLGKIKKWNDPALEKVNEGVKLPDLDISVCVRADGSGTTYVWTNYLSKVSPEWKSNVGNDQLPNWPVGNRAPKSDGMAGLVAGTKGSIGYVELNYAEGKKDLKLGAVQNKAGKFVMASLAGTIAAAESLKDSDIPDDLVFSMTDPEGADSYPICGVTWAVMYAKQPPDKAEALKKFFTWVLHDGQTHSKEQNYAPLSKALVERAQKKVDTLK